MHPINNAEIFTQSYTDYSLNSGMKIIIPQYRILFSEDLYAFQKTHIGITHLVAIRPRFDYRILGTLYEQEGEIAYIFDTQDSEAYFKPNVLSGKTEEADEESVQPLMPSGKRIRAIPESWTSSFGRQFYAQEKSVDELQRQSEADWMLRLEGQLFETGNKLRVTGFDELKRFIAQELQGIDI